MRQEIILSLVCVNVLLHPLKQVAVVESPDSGRLVKPKWSQSSTKQKGEGTNETLY